MLGQEGKRSSKDDDKLEAKRKLLFREIELSAATTERYLPISREMLIRAKMPQLISKVEIAWQNFQHVLDFKDYSISLLMDGLQEAEDQRRRANGAHSETIDRSLKTHEKRLDILDTVFYRTTQTEFADATLHYGDINYYRNKNEGVMKKINTSVNRRNQNIHNVMRSHNISKVNAFKEDERNGRRLVVAQLQKNLEDLWHQLRSVLSDYRTSTKTRRRVYEQIRRKDEFDLRSISRQFARINSLLEEISECREQINSHKLHVKDEFRNITQESNFFHNLHHIANETFISGDKEDQRSIIRMSIEYNRTIKRLKELMTKAERIFLIMQMCRKYETQDEKTLSTVIPRASRKPQSVASQKDDSFALDQIVENYHWLTNFWHRLGFAQTILAELRTERDKLSAQTKHLRMSVKRCLRNDSRVNTEMTE